jgi:hypothetical protein
MRAVGLSVGLIACLVLAASPAMAQSSQGFTNEGLVGAARIASNARDDLGETLGGFGSGMALVPGSWRKQGDHYAARLAMLPDRGWNTEGTNDYRAKLHFFDLELTPYDGAAARGQTGLTLTYRQSLLLTDAAGVPTTGLDPDGVRPAAGGFPDLPIAANGHVTMDDESVALPGDGSIWVGDEYGAYIYHYDAKGKMIAAIRPPDAFIPMRAGHESFSANSPPQGQTYDVGKPQSGRQDNQGFEGMSIAPDHKYLFAVTQSALMQDLDPKALKATRRYIRLLAYDISGAKPLLVHEYVVALPLYSDGKNPLVAAQSEMLAINDHQLLLLCRDSGGGYAGKRDASNFRKILLVDTNGASDVLGKFDAVGEAVAPLGVLRPEIVPAHSDAVLDMNDNHQLGRFGLHNGPPNDPNDLYEKWESMALAPARDPRRPNDYFLFVGSDNDFITQDGMMAGKPYKDASGANVDTLVLAYRVRLIP